MKAIVHEKFGSPELLQFEEVDMPIPKDDEVLVKVFATSINFGDKALVQGKPFLIRLMGYGLFSPKHPVPGGDIAGVVEAVGGNVEKFQPGDEVWGDISDCGMGAYAEYVAVPAGVLVPKPANITWEQAAAVPQAAIVALQGLRDNGRIQSGQKVLVNGASGGVGTFAVQIAKALETEVTGVCSAQNHELVRSIGADHIIDYKQVDFTQAEERYDLIFDIVANRPTSAYMAALNPGGSYVACAFNPTALFFGGFLSKSDGKKASSLVHKPNKSDQVFLNEILEIGKVTPVIDRTYPLAELSQAMDYLGSRQQHGKVVIRVSKE
jgi:NADPH:quinone reductase-like Zn-dependent oxidoreductase